MVLTCEVKLFCCLETFELLVTIPVLGAVRLLLPTPLITLETLLGVNFSSITLKFTIALNKTPISPPSGSKEQTQIITS